MKHFTAVLCAFTVLTFCLSGVALESGTFRLLSVADSGKLILVSQIANKTKYIFDAGSAKISVNGKPVEFRDLKHYAMVQVKYELRKSNKDGIDIDGTANEIKISVPENPK